MKTYKLLTSEYADGYLEVPKEDVKTPITEKSIIGIKSIFLHMSKDGLEFLTNLSQKGLIRKIDYDIEVTNIR